RKVAGLEFRCLVQCIPPRQSYGRTLADLSRIQKRRSREDNDEKRIKERQKRESGRRGRIRTCDPFVPNEVRYQAAPHADQRPVLYGLPAVLLPLPWGKSSVHLLSGPVSLRLAAGRCRQPAGTGCAG